MPPPVTVPTPDPSKLPGFTGREEERMVKAAPGSSSKEGAVDEGFAACA